MRKICSSNGGKIWDVDLADLQLISKYYKGVKFLMCVIDVYSKDTWFVPLKDKKVLQIINAFPNILDEPGHKPNKVWVDQDNEFYTRSMKSWFHDNGIKICSTYNEVKSVAAERFIRTLKTKIYRHMTATSKNVYIDKLDKKVDKYNKKYHSKKEMKPNDAKLDLYIDYGVEHNEKDYKLKVGDHFISK